MKDTFSWKRFGLFARAELAGERRSLLLKLGGFVVFCLVIYMLWNIKVIFAGGTVDAGGGVGYVLPRLFVAMAMGFIVYFNLSGSFKRYFSKGRGSSAFMLPAAGSEKFLYASLLNLIAVPVVLIVIALLNDALWAKLLGFDNICSVIGEWWSRSIVLVTDPMTGLFLTANIVSTFSGMAFFLAGAVVFRRHQFLLTLLANFVLSIPVFVYMQVSVTTDPESAIELLSWISSDTGSWVILGAGVLFTLLWMYIAWRRFSTLQITR